MTTPNSPSNWDGELQRLAVQAAYWQDVAARGDGLAADSATRIVRMIEQHLQLLRQITTSLAETTGAEAEATPPVPEQRPRRACPRPARRPGRGRAPVRSAVAEQLHRAEGWPLSTAEICTRLARRQVGASAVYTALRRLQDAGLCVRLRDESGMDGRPVYWCTPDSPFATGWGDRP